MEYFIISSYKHADFYRELRDALQDAGHDCTRDWLEVTKGRKDFDGTERVVTCDMQEALKADVSSIVRADVAVVLLPAGRDSCVEIGAALAFGIPVVLVPATSAPTYDPATAFSYMSHQDVYSVDGAENMSHAALADGIADVYRLHYGEEE